MTIVSILSRRDAQEKGSLSDDPLQDIGRQIPLLDGHREVASEDMAGGDNDHARFAKLVLPYLGDAYSLARWITGNRTDAEDVVQDACLRAFRAIGTVGDGSARPWVLTVVRNTAYTWLRKNRPSAILAVEDLEDVESANAKPGDPDSETPERALMARAAPAGLEAAIAALPMPYRETMILRDVQGLSYREI